MIPRFNVKFFFNIQRIAGSSLTSMSMGFNGALSRIF